MLLLVSCESRSIASATTYNCDNNTGTTLQECEALVEFYNATNGQVWNQSLESQWLQSPNPCDWFGVTCWGSSVVRVELLNLGLEGELPDLRKLKNLRTLGLIGNPKLTGKLPDLTSLSKLTNLILFNNSFDGFLPDVSQLTSLEQLVVFNNNFVGPIPDISQLSKVVVFGNELCLSPKISYQTWQKNVEMYSICSPMLHELLQGTFDIALSGAKPNDGIDDSALINQALKLLELTAPKGQKLFDINISFPNGEFSLSSSLKFYQSELVKVFGSQNASQPTTLKKLPNFGNNRNALINDIRKGAIIDARFTHDLSVENLVFVGQTNDKAVEHLWWDNGIYVGSSQTTLIRNNTFKDFGDAATLIATDADDLVGSINSSNTKIIENIFENIFQTSTTSKTGGTYNIEFAYNHVTHLKGAIKFASRIDGGALINIHNNDIEGAGSDNGFEHNNGIEIEGYSEVLIEHNQLGNGQGIGIIIRSPQSKLVNGVWNWGNISIENNQINGFRQGVYIANLPHALEKSLATASEINVMENTIRNLSATELAAIHLVGEQFEDVQIMGNDIVGSHYDVWWPNNQPTISVENNTLITP